MFNTRINPFPKFAISLQKKKSRNNINSNPLLKISFFQLFAVAGKSYEVKINFKPCFHSYVATISGEQ